MKKATKAIWIFLGITAILVGSLLLFIESRTFATILKSTAQRYMPRDFGVTGGFSELSVKLVPPGVVIKNPSVILGEKNPLGLPAGTQVDAQFIDVTFQFFQLLTGAVTINAFALHGANLKLDLDEKFFEAREKQAPKAPTGQRFSWDRLVRFNFRSVSLIESQVDIRVTRTEDPLSLHVQSFVKELTVGRGTIDGKPSYDIAVDLQKAALELGSFKHAVAQLQASMSINADGAAIPNFGVQEGELSAHANGQLKGNLLRPNTLKADLSYIIRGPLPLWLDPSLAGRYLKLPKGTSIDGLLTVEGRLTADLRDFEKTLGTKAKVEIENADLAGWRMEKITLNGEWQNPSLALDGVDIEMGGGKVRIAKTEYDTRNRSKPMQLELSLENADFRRLLGPQIRAVYPLHMFLSGKVDADITPGDGFAIEGATDLVVREFSFDNQRPDVSRPLMVLFAVPEFALNSHFAVDQAGFRFYDTDLKMPNGKLHAGGTVDGKNGFDIDVRGKVDLHDIGKMSAFEIGGKGDLHWTIKGKKQSGVQFGFEADLEGGYYLNLNLGKVKGRLVYNDGNDTLYFSDLSAQQGLSKFIANGTINLGATDAADMTIQVPKATIQDFADVFDNFLKASVHWYPRSLVGQLSGTIKVSGQTPLDKLSVEGDMELGNVDLWHEVFRTASVHAGYRRGAYVAENLSVRKKGGLIKGNLFFGADGDMKWNLRSDGFSTLDIDHIASFGIGYRAPISLETKGQGRLGDLNSLFHLAFGDGVVKTYAVPKSEIDFVTQSGRVHGDLAVFAGQLKGKLDMGWEKGSPSSFDVEAKQFDFEPILIGVNPDLSEDRELEAEVSGGAHLRFRTGELSKLSGVVKIDSYALRRSGYDLSLANPVSIDMSEGAYGFRGAKFVGGGTDLVIDGGVKDQKIDYAINGPFNLGIFQFLVPQLASVHGSTQVAARIYGLADEPHLKAKVTAAGLDVRISAIEQLFEDTRFSVDWTDGVLEIPSITAKFANGTMNGDGTIRLYLDKVPDLDLHFALSNSRVKVYPVSYARVSGKASISGSELPYKLKGAFGVQEALINEDFNPAENAKVLRSSKFMPQKGGGTGGDIQIFLLDVDLAAERGVFVRNDLFDCEVRGNITVVNTLEAPRILGQATVLHGRLLFKDNFFTIQSGNLAFKNPSTIDPEFDLSGLTEIKGYKISLAANGLASSPNITFQSQPPLSQNDIVNLLTLGVTSSEYQSIGRENRDAYSRDELYGLLFSQSGVNRSLQQKLGLKLRVDQSQLNVPDSAFRPKTGSDLDSTVAPKVVLQKEITKNLNASVGSTVGVGDNQEHSADLEYSVTRHWSVLGTYEDQKGTLPSQSRTSVGADLKYKLRFH